MSIKQQKGLTLIELMIGLLVGAIVAAGAISIFTGSVRNSTDNINLTRLNQDLRAMMDIMERDIRRAGFVTSDPQTNLNSVLNNPFFSATTDIAIYDPGPVQGTCIVYAYNRDDNDANNDDVIGDIETPSAVDSNERLGFRLDSGGELDMRKYGATNENCTVGAEWENITEPEVEITALTFALEDKVLNVTSIMTDADSDGCLDGDDQNPTTASSSCKTGNYGNGFCDSGEACNTCSNTGVSGDPACLYIRTITITLAGRLRNDPPVTQTISEQVRVRNDKFLAAVSP
jgi:type IV pilus assembly protein PilW